MGHLWQQQNKHFWEPSKIGTCFVARNDKLVDHHGNLLLIAVWREWYLLSHHSRTRLYSSHSWLKMLSLEMETSMTECIHLDSCLCGVIKILVEKKKIKLRILVCITAVHTTKYHIFSFVYSLAKSLIWTYYANCTLRLKWTLKPFIFNFFNNTEYFWYYI